MTSMKGDNEMTTLQTEACQLIEQLPEEQVVEVVTLMKKMKSEAKSEEEKRAEREAELQRRREGLEGLLKLREKLIAMDVDWAEEVKQAIKEKYFPC